MAETTRWVRLPRIGWLVAVLALPAAGYATACGDDESDDAGTASPTSPSATVTSTDGNLDGFCTEIEGLTASVEEFFAAAETGAPGDVQAAVAATSAQVADLAARAPAQLDGAMSDLADIFGRLDDELRVRDYDVAQLHEDGASPIDDDRFDESGEDIEAFIASTCEVAPEE